MKILVTGGLGFIGSHTVVELLNQGHDVVIADNLVNSKIEVLGKIQQITGRRPSFFKFDVTNETEICELFASDQLDGVFHFAGLKSVGESIERPLEYYHNNLLSTIVLSKLCLKYGVKKFVFSSSATVYGNQVPPVYEEMPLLETTNPYGRTKAMCEQILADAALAHPDFAVTLLRYFNPIGAHPSGLIGEEPSGIPNNLMPYIAKVAKGELELLRVFGNDYDTADGTGVRDFIHVVDLAKGHVQAIEHIRPGVNIYNLGTGRGTSVLELIHAFQEVNGIKIPYAVTERRAGDIAASFADVSKARRELNWRSELTIKDMVYNAWQFEKNTPQKKPMI